MSGGQQVLGPAASPGGHVRGGTACTMTSYVRTDSAMDRSTDSAMDRSTDSTTDRSTVGT